MLETGEKTSVVRFGVFELDIRTGELRREGLRIKVQEQPRQILEMLLARPGELVSREEIKAKLWPSDTFVDFDHGMNAAMRRLRDALGDSADVPKLIETLPRRGYRFIGEVSRNGAALQKNLQRNLFDEAEIPSSGIEPLTKPADTPRFRKWVSVVTVGMILVLAAGWHWWPQKKAIESIAVLPFVNETQDTRLNYLGDGIASSLIDSLAEVSALRVVPRSSSFQLNGKSIGVEEAAKALHVRAILLGRIRKQQDKLRLSIELIDSQGNRLLWGNDFPIEEGDQARVQREITDQTVKALHIRLTSGEQARTSHRQTTNEGAYNAYLRGRSLIERRERKPMLEGLALMRQAADLDPDYVYPYIGMATAYGLLPSYDAMNPREALLLEEAATRRAVELEPDLAESVLHLAMIQGKHRRYPEARATMRRAIVLAPNSAFVHYANALTMPITSPAGCDEKIAELKKVLELDPLARVPVTALINTYGECHRLQEAEAMAKAVDNKFMLSLVFSYEHRYPEALTLLQEVIKTGRNEVFHNVRLAYLYGKTGKKEEARKIIAEFLARRSNSYVIGGYSIAKMYAGLDDGPSVVKWLQVADEERDPHLMNLPNDPTFDPFRNDPAFLAVQAKSQIPF